MVMKRLRNHITGIDQGDETLFMDYENGGEMWTGEGNRERRATVRFSEKYSANPSVMLTVSLWDVDYSTNIRSEVVAENISKSKFEIVFRTWGNTRIAQARVSWMAIGEMEDEDIWDVP